MGQIEALNYLAQTSQREVRGTASSSSDEPGQYGTPSRTSQGEWVRSKSEKKIADYFMEHNIRYKYEIGVKTRAEGYKRIFAKPDFCLPDYDVYVEFWGLAGSSKDYDDNIKAKAAQYHDNGIRFISIFPEDLKDFDSSFKSKFRDVMGYPFSQSPPGQAVGARYCTKCGTPVLPPGRFCVKCGSTIH